MRRDITDVSLEFTCNEQHDGNGWHEWGRNCLPNQVVWDYPLYLRKFMNRTHKSTIYCFVNCCFVLNIKCCLFYFDFFSLTVGILRLVYNTFIWNIAKWMSRNKRLPRAWIANLVKYPFWYFIILLIAICYVCLFVHFI